LSMNDTTDRFWTRSASAPRPLASESKCLAQS